jgi:hypothetical protein
MDESNGNGEGRIHEFSPYFYREDTKNLDFNFLTAGQQAAKFSWQDKRTLSQIEQMTGYKVKPRGVVSQFKHGGFVVYEENGHGLVAAISDLERLDWKSAKEACEKLISNGYSDWHLPSKEELNSVYDDLGRFGAGGFYKHSIYWGSTDSQRGGITQGFQTGFTNYDFKDQKYDVRPVRTF